MSEQELMILMQAPENECVEKTSSLNRLDKFGEAVCAFGNDLMNTSLPGYFLVGVKDDGSRSGYRWSEKDSQTLLEFRTDGRIVPPPSITTKVFPSEEGDVLVAEILPSQSPPVRFLGRVWVRAGARKSQATSEEERRLSEKRSVFSPLFDSMPCFGSQISDLNLDVFKISYLPRAIDAEVLAANHREPLEQLASLKFFDLRANLPTHAGVLVFGYNPMQFLFGAYVQYVRFEGLDVTAPFSAEKRFVGDLNAVMRAMKEFVQYVVVKEVHVELGVPVQRNYPATAIEELLFNAVIHRDYQSNAPIMFYEFSDRIEIGNPGGLFGNVRADNFPNVSDYRNPSLAEAARTLGYVNKFNVGVRRAMDALHQNGNAAPEFETTIPGYFRVKVAAKPLHG